MSGVVSVTFGHIEVVTVTDAIGSFPLPRAILFAITSGRPPRGGSMLVEPVHLETPIAAFNGGLWARSDMSIMEQRAIPEAIVASKTPRRAA